MSESHSPQDCVETQKSHPRQWVDSSDPAYIGGPAEFRIPPTEVGGHIKRSCTCAPITWSATLSWSTASVRTTRRASSHSRYGTCSRRAPLRADRAQATPKVFATCSPGFPTLGFEKLKFKNNAEGVGEWRSNPLANSFRVKQYY